MTDQYIVKVLLFLSFLILITSCGFVALQNRDYESVQPSTNREFTTSSRRNNKPYSRSKVRTINRTRKVTDPRTAIERDCWKKTRLRVCDRSVGMRDALVEAVFGDDCDTAEYNTCCDSINYCDLEEITSLDLSGDSDPTEVGYQCIDHEIRLVEQDFEGLTKLTFLDLSGNCLRYLESKTYGSGADGFFRHLDSIERINLQDTYLRKISQSFFKGVLDTLDDRGVIFNNGFIYCGTAPRAYRDIFGDRFGRREDHEEVDAHNSDNHDPPLTTSAYCY